MPQAVVFDLDGTLLDTERLARVTFLQACADVGWPADEPLYNQCVGTTWDVTERIMRSGYGPDFPYARMQQRWSEIYHEHVDHRPVEPRPGIPDLLERLAALGLPMALATSSRRPTVETKMRMSGLGRYFRFFLCGGETPRGKPDPGPYLEAARRLKVEPAVCWAVEDSDNGVRSAHAAGLMVFQIPDEIPPSDEIAGLGHPILGSAVELTEYLNSL